MKNLKLELSDLLNRHCRENESNTPDFVLAGYLVKCLEAFEDAVNERDTWYGQRPKPGRHENSELVEAEHDR